MKDIKLHLVVCEDYKQARHRLQYIHDIMVSHNIEVETAYVFAEIFVKPINAIYRFITKDIMPERLCGLDIHSVEFYNVDEYLLFTEHRELYAQLYKRLSRNTDPTKYLKYNPYEEKKMPKEITMKVEVDVNTVLHDALSQFAQEYYNEYSVVIENISFDWDRHSIGKDSMRVSKVSIDSHKEV